MHPKPESRQISALDGFSLSSTHYSAEGEAEGNLLIAGATGVPQRFYQRIALYAASQGLNVMTLDYRGIGLSRPARLKGFKMHYLDWARLDLAAAVALLAKQDLPLYVLGHSFGGHAFGLLPNHHHISRFAVCGTGAGWHGWMPWRESLKVRMMWHLVLPVLTRIKGYSPWSKLGIGEDLPQDVFYQWRAWCQYPHYFFDNPDTQDLLDCYHKVRTPSLFINATDDLWAMPASRDAFIRAYANAPIHTLDIESQGTPIGHMGYFRAQHQDLWQPIVQWLKQGSPASIAASHLQQYAPGEFNKAQLLLPNLAL